MFIVANNVQYHVICVPTDDRWSVLHTFDTLSDAQSRCDAFNTHPFAPGDRYHVSALSMRDLMCAGRSVEPPAPV